jgi:hypothetical protein
MDGLRIDRLPEGGFVVTNVPGTPGLMATCLFACSGIDDALGFIKDNLQPETCAISGKVDCGECAQPATASAIGDLKCEARVPADQVEYCKACGVLPSQDCQSNTPCIRPYKYAKR